PRRVEREARTVKLWLNGVGDQTESDAEEGERGCRADGYVEVPGHPGGVVNQDVEAEAGVDDATGSAEYERDHGQYLGDERRVAPGQLRYPPEHASAPRPTAADLHR